MIRSRGSFAVLEACEAPALYDGSVMSLEDQDVEFLQDLLPARCLDKPPLGSNHLSVVQQAALKFHCRARLAFADCTVEAAGRA